MFGLFTRNYVITFLGMLFFGTMFFSNLDMVFQKTTVLTENGIPNFVGWLLPMMLFLYFGLFFIFHNRLLFGCKKTKKSLKLLFLLVSILYSLFSLVLFVYILSGSDNLISFFIITILFGFLNFYYHIQVKHKKYFSHLNKKKFLHHISLYGIVLTVLLIIFNRGIGNIQAPENYFNIDIQSLSENNREFQIFGEINPDQYISKIAKKEDAVADYNVIIYNLPNETLDEINRIYELTSVFPELGDNTTYSFNNISHLQKINLLKSEYHLLHNETETALGTINTIIKNNEKILAHSKNMNDFNIYIDNYMVTVNIIEKYQSLFSEDQKQLLSQYITPLDKKDIWKHILEKQFNYELSNIGKLYNIPLLINKEETFKVAIYIEYLKSENLINSKEDIHFKNIFRKNYLGLQIVEDSQKDFHEEYEKLETLFSEINTLKNTLN